MPLSLAVQLWATATVSGEHNRKGSSPKAGDGLSTQVKLFSTPNASDWKRAGSAASTQGGDLSRDVHRFCRAFPSGSIMCETEPTTLGDVPHVSEVMTEQSGQLTPQFHAWLMGYPAEYTSSGLPEIR
jgi:hypothetical protein